MEPTPEQRRIIEHVQGHCLVFAVAGSGKTTTMIERILHLIREKHARPNRILACTFSKEAARTIEERLARYPETVGVTVCTLHSLANRVLMEAQRLGFTDLKRGEEHFSRRLFQQARQELIDEDGTEKQAYFNIKFDDFQTYLSVQKANLRLPYVPDDLPDWAQQLIAEPDQGRELYAGLYDRHDALRRLEGKVDFDDSIVEAWRLMAQFPVLRDNLAHRWDYVHVDEFQDVNLAQSEMMDLVAAQCCSYTAIGDDDQTIYQWRGADPRYILDFAARYQATKFTLTTNFRCPMGVIALADQVIGRNTVREPKHLRASKGGNGVILHEHAPGQGAHVAIKALEEGHAPGDIVILVRTYAQTGEMEQVFLEKGIPYLVVGGVPFYQRHEVEVLLAYLRLALADLDIQRGLDVQQARRLTLLKDWKTVANTPNRYLNKRQVDDLAARLWRGSQTLAQTLQSAALGLPHYAVTVVTALGAALENLTDDLALTQGKDPLLDFANAIDYTDHLIKTAPTREFGEERAGSVRALAEMAQERSLGELVTYVTALGQQARYESSYKKAAEDDVPRVTLMTAFRAKGLEWPVVIVPDCKEGLYRIKDSADQAVAEEERRVFYVALTRAKKELHLIVDGEETTPFLTGVKHEQVVAAHGRLVALMGRDPGQWSGRETLEAATILHTYQHAQFVQAWLDRGYRSRLLRRFQVLSDQLAQQPLFDGQPVALELLALTHYQLHGPLNLSRDAELEDFEDVASVIRGLQSLYAPVAQMPSSQPTGRDALGRQTADTGLALSPQEMRVGLAIRHHKFGLGTVREVVGQGQKMQVTLFFENQGVEKKMLVVYASLQPAERARSSVANGGPPTYELHLVPKDELLPF